MGINLITGILSVFQIQHIGCQCPLTHEGFLALAITDPESFPKLNKYVEWLR